LGKDWRIIFPENELNKFVSGMSFLERESFSKLLAFFCFHMKPLSRLNIKDDTINDFFGPMVWSNFSLVVMMSVLEKYTKGRYKRKEFLELLIENIPINSEEQLIMLSAEQRKTNPPPSVLRFSELFSKNLEEKEIDRIIKNYMAEKQSSGEIKISSIEEVFKHLWEEVRSGFIHNVGLESIYNESTIFKLSKKPGVITVSDNLSMSNFLFLSWKAIFRHLGYAGEMNSNYTKKEIENRQTVDGTKL